MIDWKFIFRSDHVGHAIFSIGLCVFGLVLYYILSYFNLFGPDIFGSAIAISFFYGRERRDYENKIVRETGCALESLDYKDWGFWSWWKKDKDCVFDLLFPIVACGLFIIIFRILGLYINLF